MPHIFPTQNRSNKRDTSAVDELTFTGIQVMYIFPQSSTHFIHLNESEERRTLTWLSNNFFDSQQSSNKIRRKTSDGVLTEQPIQHSHVRQIARIAPPCACGVMRLQF